MVLVGSSAWAVAYRATNLGVLGTSDCSGHQIGSSSAASINNAMQVVGISSTSVPDQQAVFIWSVSGGLQQLGDLDATYYKPSRITDTGKVLLSYYKGYYDLTTGTLTALSPYAPVAENSSGQMCANWNNGGYSLPKIKSKTGSWTDIDVLSYPSSVATDMNENGQVCGYAYNYSANKYTAFLWNGSGNLVNIGVPDGYQISRAYAINDNGWVLGSAFYYANSRWYNEPFIWHEGNGFTLLPFPSVSGYPVDINNKNQVIGCCGWDGISGTSWVWSESDGITTLNNLAATSINDAGWIVGTGHADIGSCAFLLQPVPEPQSLVVMFGALMGMVVAIRRRK